MNTCSEKIVNYMHAYLDDEISEDEQRELDRHLKDCLDCQMLLDDLSSTTSFLENTMPLKAPDGFVNGVMSRLPKEKSQVGIRRWLRHHPFLAAAAMFFILMSVSVFSSYGNNQQFSVTKQPNLVVEGETVIVPEGLTVQGDIIVENGNLRVEGDVDGNIIVINGSKYMASTAVVSGEIEEIDKVFDWLWYKIKNVTKDIFPSTKKEVPVVE